MPETDHDDNDDILNNELEELMLHYDATHLPATAKDSQTGASESSSTIAKRFRRGGVLTVTDLCAPLWCQLQYYFDLCKSGGRRPTTDAMRDGSAAHLELERELHEIVAVSIETEADQWGLRLINLLSGLHELTERGMCRELPLFGFIDELNGSQHDELLLVGVADEIHRDLDGRLRIKEYKTRRRQCLPSDTQRMQTRFQLMLYRRLLMRLNDTLSNRLPQLLHAIQIDFSPAFHQHLVMVMGQSADVSLDGLRLSVVDKLSQVVAGGISREMQVEYLVLSTEKNDSEMKKTRLFIETIVDDKEEIWRELIVQSQRFWSGTPLDGALQSLSGVQDVEEAWKCIKCLHSDNCHWRQKMSQSLCGVVNLKQIDKNQQSDTSPLTMGPLRRPFNSASSAFTMRLFLEYEF